MAFYIQLNIVIELGLGKITIEHQNEVHTGPGDGVIISIMHHGLLFLNISAYNIYIYILYQAIQILYIHINISKTKKVDV